MQSLSSIEEKCTHGFRVLILGCSKAKHPGDTPLPAIERYDGPQFRIVRKHSALEPQLKIFILSGLLGLIESKELVSTYDVVADGRITQEIIRNQWDHLIEPILDACLSVGIAMGRDYFSLLTACLKDSVVPPVTLIQGTQGRRLKALKQWLDPSYQGKPRQVTPSLTGPFADLNLEGTKQRLANRAPQRLRSTTWNAVSNRGELVPLKPLIAEITGFPTSNFETRHAMQLAMVLGLEVRKGG